jgi:hypothetical protein
VCVVECAYLVGISFCGAISRAGLALYLESVELVLVAVAVLSLSVGRG